MKRLTCLLFVAFSFTGKGPFWGPRVVPPLLEPPAIWEGGGIHQGGDHTRPRKRAFPNEWQSSGEEAGKRLQLKMRFRPKVACSTEAGNRLLFVTCSLTGKSYVSRPRGVPPLVDPPGLPKGGGANKGGNPTRPRKIVFSGKGASHREEAISGLS